MSTRFIITIVLTAWLANTLPRFFDGAWIGWIISVPGTFLHEAAHYGFALLLGGNPGTFSIFPSFSGGQMVSYGHITFTPTWWNAATIALGPVLVAPASIWLMAVGSRLRLHWNALCIWAASTGFYSAQPSHQDWLIAVSHPLSFAPALGLFVACLYIWWKLTLAALAHT